MHHTSQILCPIASKSQTEPDKIAILTPEKKISYKTCHQHILSIQKSLKKYNIKTGSIVTWNSQNTILDALLFWALLRENAIAFPFSHRLPTHQQQKLYKTAQVSHVIEKEKNTKSTHKKRKFIPKDDIEKAIKHHSTLPDLEHYLTLPAISNFTLTSGTTQAPKIAVHTLNNHYQNAHNTNQILQTTSNSYWLWSLPISHVSGLAILMRTFFANATLIISDHPLQETLTQLPCTHVSMVPTQLHRLLQSPQTDWQKNIQNILIGGAPLLPNLEKKALSIPCDVFKSYGLTELSAQVQIQNIKNPEHLYTSHAEFKIGNNEQILIKSPCLFKGYLQADQAITCSLLEENWFETSDRGSILPSGHLKINGRKDNLFISGGENIQPEEIESHIHSLPNIHSSIILPLPDIEFGSRPIAIISPYSEDIKQTIQTHLQKTLPKFKHPIEYYPWPEHIPKIEKLSRKKLQQWLTTNILQEASSSDTEKYV